MDILRECGITQENRILDLGCGKGYAMYLMSQFPFAGIGGVELSGELCAAAEKNMQIVCGDKVKDGTVFLRCANAVEYGRSEDTQEEFDTFDYYYIYNSFPYAVMEEVLKNMEESFLRRRRKMTVLYVYPEARELFDRSEYFYLERQFFPEKTRGGVWCYTTAP